MQTMIIFIVAFLKSFSVLVVQISLPNKSIYFFDLVVFFLFNVIYTRNHIQHKSQWPECQMPHRTYS